MKLFVPSVSCDCDTGERDDYVTTVKRQCMSRFHPLFHRAYA